VEVAVDWYAKAIRILEPVWRREPRLNAARRYLRNSHWGRARAWTRLGRHAEALPEWDRTLELEAGALRNSFRLQRALTLAHLGNHSQAVAEADDLAQGKDLRGDTLYDLACVYAVSSAAAQKDASLPHADRERLAERRAGQAVELLAKAQATGYFKERARVEHLKQDTDLDALRARPDYQKLVRELEGPAESLAH
jgi:hypothetical protein